MDSNTFTALVAIASTMLGGLVAWVSQYYSSKKQDERRFKHEEEKKHELDRKRRVAAYRRLKSLTDRFVAKTQARDVRSDPESEFEGIEAIIAQNYDVLDESTVAAWDTKEITGTGPWVPPRVIILELFIADVNKHYEELRYKAIPPTENAT